MFAQPEPKIPELGDEDVPARAEFIPNESDHAEQIDSERGYDTDLRHMEIKKKSLEQFLSRSSERPTYNRIMVFNQLESTGQLASNWIYVQLDQGSDELLTKHNIFESFQQAGIEGIRNIRIYADDCLAADKIPEPAKEAKADKTAKKISTVIKMANKATAP